MSRHNPPASNPPNRPPRWSTSPDVGTWIRRGPPALREILEQVLPDRSLRYTDADLAEVTNGLGREGYEEYARLLAEASVEEHRLAVDFLGDASVEMKPLVAEVLCQRATADTASSFGQALGRREDGVKLLVKQLVKSSPEQEGPVGTMLTAALGERAEEELVDQLLLHADARVRAAAVRQAREMGHEEASIPLYRDPDVRVRLAVAETLNDSSGDAEAYRDARLSLCNDRDGLVRALGALSLLTDDQADPGLLQRLRTDRDPRVPLAVSSALIDDDLPARLEQALASPDGDLRQFALRLAAQQDAAHARAVLTTLMLDSSPDELAFFLEHLTPRDLELVKLGSRIARESPPPRVRRATLMLVGWVRRVEGALGVASELLDRSLPLRVRRLGLEAVRSYRPECYPKLLELLSPDEPLLPDVLDAVAYGLGTLDDPGRAFLNEVIARWPDGPQAQVAREVLQRSQKTP